MGRRHLRRRLVATAVLAAALFGATQLFAAVIVPHNAGPQMRTMAGGAFSMSNSRDGAAIFTASNLAPGHSTEGTVTIANTGSAAGSLALSASELSDSPGTYGGALSEVLDLQIAATGSGPDTEVYAGRFDSMPEQQLSPLAPGESRTYRFSVSLPDGGSPSADWSGDNVYQDASVSIAYDWTLTESAGGGGTEPPEAAPTAPVSPGPIPPDPQDSPSDKMIGTPSANRLVGSAGDDLIYGLAGSDRLFGMGGGDYLLGGSGVDWVWGGAGSDRLRGGVGRDHIYGGSGADVILARDGEVDTVDCGPGADIVYVDPGDRTRNCETVHSQYGRLFSGRESGG
jgi:Ca2+-binding RTX toxin-like protein